MLPWYERDPYSTRCGETRDLDFHGGREVMGGDEGAYATKGSVPFTRLVAAGRNR